MNDYQLNQMLGHREPRSKLLPPYLTINPYFKEFADALDRVWATKVDNKLEVLKYIRNMWVTNPTVEQKIIDQQLIDLEDWTRPERQLLVRQVNLLGMKLKSAGLLTDQNYLTVSRFLGRYWFGKGTEAFIQFINFALILDLEVNKLWAERLPGLENQYSNFTREPSPGQPPGLPIWEGGTWFPTTHVEIVANKGLGDVDQTTLAEFFYEIANYNLVLAGVNNVFEIPVVDGPNSTTTRIVAAGLYCENVMTISTAGRSGIVGPETITIGGIPTNVYGSPGPLLGRPTSWFEDSEGRLFPTYKPVTTSNVLLPTRLVGGSLAGDPVADNVLLRAPTSWAKIPGTLRPNSTIPAWSSEPPAVVDPALSLSIIGGRDAFLSSPRGWLETDSQFIPYW